MNPYMTFMDQYITSVSLKIESLQYIAIYYNGSIFNETDFMYVERIVGEQRQRRKNGSLQFALNGLHAINLILLVISPKTVLSFANVKRTSVMFLSVW